MNKTVNYLFQLHKLKNYFHYMQELFLFFEKKFQPLENRELMTTTFFRFCLILGFYGLPLLIKAI